MLAAAAKYREAVARLEAWYVHLSDAKSCRRLSEDMDRQAETRRRQIEVDLRAEQMADMIEELHRATVSV
jgi:3'-phosphoadenosine 5'-phosphosulfate sulfotransferase